MHHMQSAEWFPKVQSAETVGAPCGFRYKQLRTYVRTYEGGVLACDGADSESQLAACGSVSDLSDDLP